jgi:CheY-like chemotaxis protein
LTPSNWQSQTLSHPMTTNTNEKDKTPTILIADDDHDLVRALETRCRALRLNVLTAHDSLTAINLIHQHRPALVCLDVNMPGGNGLGVCEMLNTDEQFATMPVIIMTGDTKQETIRRCYYLCAFYVEKGADIWGRIEPLLRELLALPKPTPTEQPPVAPAPLVTPISAESSADPPATAEGREVMNVVFEMLGTDVDYLDRSTEEEDDCESPPWVLCIDDDADYSNVLRHRLEEYGVAVLRAFEGMEGFRFAFTRPADVILLDYELPNGQGDYILDRLKRNPLTRGIPVIVITGKRDKSLERRMRSLGAANFFTKPPDMLALIKELRRHIDLLPTPAVP